MVGVDLCLIVASISLSVFGYVSEFFLLWLHAQSAPDAIKLLSYQAMLFKTYFADVTLFVALWHMQDQLLLPDDEVSSNLISHFGGLAAMMALGVANTLHGGFERERYRMLDGIMIPRFYFTYFFRRLSNTKSKATQTEPIYLQHFGHCKTTCSKWRQFRARI